jgi:CheY-like chemotaxis protein
MPESPSRPIVLLVEDSEDDAYFFRHTVKKSGLDCQLIHVVDGGAARDYLAAAIASPQDAANPWPDLIFLDLKLPTFSGFEVLEWIRAQKIARELDVAVLSGSEDDSDVSRAMALGASAYYVKPVTADQLRARFSRRETSAAHGAV